jgi:hypothetical protein
LLKKIVKACMMGTIKIFYILELNDCFIVRRILELDKSSQLELTNENISTYTLLYNKELTIVK